MAHEDEPLLLSDEAREALGEEDFDLVEYATVLSEERTKHGIQSGLRPPNYHLSTEPETISCGNCEFFDGDKLRCTLYDAAVEKDGVSDAWTPPPDF